MLNINALQAGCHEFHWMPLEVLDLPELKSVNNYAPFMCKFIKNLFANLS